LIWRNNFISFALEAETGILGIRVGAGVRVGVWVGFGVGVAVEAGTAVDVGAIVGSATVVAGVHEDVMSTYMKKMDNLFMMPFLSLPL
jgi:hypothetical protein